MPAPFPVHGLGAATRLPPSERVLLLIAAGTAARKRPGAVRA